MRPCFETLAHPGPLRVPPWPDVKLVPVDSPKQNVQQATSCLGTHIEGKGVETTDQMASARAMCGDELVKPLPGVPLRAELHMRIRATGWHALVPTAALAALCEGQSSSALGKESSRTLPSEPTHTC